MPTKFWLWPAAFILLIFVCMVSAYPVVMIGWSVAIRVSPNYAAEVLINEDGSPGPSAYQWGDKLLPALREHSHNFDDLKEASAYNVALVVSHNKSTAATALGEELYSRDDLFPKLVGAVIKASRGTLPIAEFERKGLIGEILIKASEGSHSSGSSLAILSAKYARASQCVPMLIKLLLNKPFYRDDQKEIAEALGTIGDVRAAADLEAVLRDPGVLARSAIFKALFVFSKKAAISAAIENFPKKMTHGNRAPEYYYQDKAFIDELEAVTDQHFGMDEAAWKQWLVVQTDF